MVGITPLLVSTSAAVTVASFTVALPSANVTVGQSPAGVPPSALLPPSLKTLALGMTRDFRMTARSTHARGSSAVPPSASKAAVKASSVAANQSEREPASSSASTSLAFVEDRGQCAELSSRNCSVHHVC